MGKDTALLILVLLLLAAIIAIIIVCFRTTYGLRPLEEEEPLWKTSVVHQVHARSLYDVHPNGTGDIAGITSKADYLKELGVGIVCISPIYKSPMKDTGFDISNFTDIDPVFGNMAEFDDLITAFHQRGLKVVLEIVPNHSSDQHEWFLRSVEGEAPYGDYYTWADPKGVDAHGNPVPPNNWMSVYKGSAWQWNEKRRQFYLHQFLAEEPDLNYRNPLLREEMKKVLVFWVEKGVDGFMVQTLTHLLETEDLSQDEPTASGPHDPRDYNYLNHTLTTNHPETLVVLREWRLVLDQYPNKVLMVSPTGENSESVMSYYGNSTHPLADIPLNSLLINSLTDRSHVTGPTLRSIIGLGLDKLPKGKWANWLLGNADQRRTATRVGTDLVDALNMMILLLPGTPVVYYGEEIGMEDTAITWNETRDSLGLRWGPDHYRDHSRDPARTPMQWDDSKLAGFTTSNSTWLPVNPNYKTLNVKGQSEAPQSHLKIFKELTVLRGQEAFRDGYLQFPVVTKNIFTFIRYVERADSYMLVVNTSVDDVVVNLHLNSTVQLPQSGTVVLRSSSDTFADTLPGSEVLLDEVHLVAGEGLLLKLSLQSP